MTHTSDADFTGCSAPSGRCLTRREALRVGAGALAGVTFVPGQVAASLASSDGGPRPQDVIYKRIPGSREEIPAVGLGTWQTFMVDTEEEREPLREVLRSFFELGGRVVDSSPMYDPAEEVTGDLAADLGIVDDLWISTKVWTEGEEEGRAQMETSMSRLRRSSIEVMHVHNLVDVEVHLETLAEWKEQGRFRYIGITNTSAQRYPAVEELILQDDRIDFVQTNYSLAERESAERILPAARERGVAVMVARPFAGGELFSRTEGEPLPEWAAEFDCTEWSQFFLKYIISHPAVTCAIPATSNPDHLRENMGGGMGRLPDDDTRRRMEGVIDAL